MNALFLPASSLFLFPPRYTNILPSPFLNAKWGKVSREMTADEFFPSMRSQVHWSDLTWGPPVIKWPLTFRTDRGHRSDEVLLWRGEGIERMGRGWNTNIPKVIRSTVLQHFLQRDLTGDYTWTSFGINIYEIQNDTKRAGVGFFNALPPHSSRDQAQDEKCAQEGVCP